VVSAGIALFSVQSKLGSPKFALHLIRPEAKEGLYFSVSQSTENIYNDLDKTMLTALSTLRGAGIYAVAYRIIEAAFVPVNSVLWASYSRFFVKGAAGIQGTAEYAKRLLSRASAYSVLVTVGLIVLAPLIPRLLGSEYLASVEAVRWLAPILLLRTVHRFFSNSLTGAGFQGVRTATQGAVALFNILLNFWLIPAYSWRGAAWSSLASDGLLLVSTFLIVSRLGRQHSQALQVKGKMMAAMPEVGAP
jgi:O-antigen/teichoic acid export membrane protein